MSRALIWFNSLGFIGFGLVCFASPPFVADLVGYEMLSPDAVTEIRAQYGGLFLAIGGFGALVSTQQRLALQFFGLVYAGLASGRIVGLLLDGDVGMYTFGTAAFEVLMSVLLLVLWVREKPPV